MRKKFIRISRYYVYILECRNGTYYTGYTNNLRERIKLHNNGDGAKYLRGKAPVRLVYAKEYKYYKNAVVAERRIKTFSRKEKDELARIYDSQTYRSLYQDVWLAVVRLIDAR